METIPYQNSKIFQHSTEKKKSKVSQTYPGEEWCEASGETETGTGETSRDVTGLNEIECTF